MPYAHIFWPDQANSLLCADNSSGPTLPTFFADLSTMSEKCPATTAAGQGKTKHYFEMCNRSKCKTKRTQNKA